LGEFKLKDKTILIFADEHWGEMLLSKHHYAINLAKMGNTVYFINPPENHSKKVSITTSKITPYLHIIDSGIWNIQRFRFHSNIIFKLLIKLNLKRIKNSIKRHIDIVWNFGLIGYCDYSSYKNSLKIAHPVDFVPLANQYTVKGADIMFSVANEILTELKEYKIPSYFINHSVNENLIETVSTKYKTTNKKNRLKTGYVGNLLRADIDHEIIIDLIKSNPDVDFIFIGNYTSSNIGGHLSKDTNTFIHQLKTLENAILKGVLTQTDLHLEISTMDIFLICYNKERDNCKGTNYHKIMEYIATGKVIISNHVSTYKDSNLLEMCNSNHKMKELFSTVKNDISLYNSKDNQKKRIKFAKENTYTRNIIKIESIISKSISC